MTEPKVYYRAQAERWEKEVAAGRKRRNALTVLRILFFMGLIFGVYALAAFEGVFLWLGIEAGVLAGFIGLGVLDMGAAGRIRRAEECLRCCRIEEGYLRGDLTELDSGKEYVLQLTARPEGHPYAHDLDIFGEDSLFQRINRTVTYGGRKRLVDSLLEPCKKAGEIRERQEAAADLSGKPEWLLNFRVAGLLRKTPKVDLAGVANGLGTELNFSSPAWRMKLIVLNVLMGAAVLAAMLNLASWLYPILLFFAQLLIVSRYLKKINRLHHGLDQFVKVLGGYSEMIALIHDQSFGSRRMEALKKQLFEAERNALVGFRKLARILGDLDQRGNLMVALLLNGLYMRDIYVVRGLEKWREKYLPYVPDWLSAVEQVDVLVSMGNYRFNHPDYIVPEIVDDLLLDAREMGHPMLETDGREMVRNDFEVRKLHELYIVTGANMAGKSTFLRTVGVNLVLALSGNVVCAREFRCGVMGIFTSMRTTDNLSKGTSYFHAELLRLQQLIRMAEQEEKLFVILDEMLKGTNSTDKLNGSLKFLEKLLQYPVAGLVATHDLGLGELARRFEGNFRNVCFEIDHTEDDILYDYKLKEGVSRNMNASILLEKMGLI